MIATDDVCANNGMMLLVYTLYPIQG